MEAMRMPQLGVLQCPFLVDVHAAASAVWASATSSLWSAKNLKFRRPRSMRRLFESLNIQDWAYFLAEVFIVVNTIHHLFIQDSTETDIGYWFRKDWVILPDFLSHYLRSVLLVHFFAGMISLFGMRFQTNTANHPALSEDNRKRHKFVGYVVLLNQILVHSPTVFIMTNFVTVYERSRKVFYVMTFVVTMKMAIKTMAAVMGEKKNIPEHRRSARTLYNYISTFTKGRIYMYLILPIVPNPWRALHVFLSDVVSIAVSGRYSMTRILQLSAGIATYGLLIEKLPQLWYLFGASGIAYAVIYA